MTEITSGPILYIVVPCYNEEEILSEAVNQLGTVLTGLMDEALVSKNSVLLFVDDGSKDHTWELIEKFNQATSFVSGLKLSRNVGHQNALLAGLMTAKDRADCVISIDADLQDDVRVIREFVVHYLAGCDIVYGVRRGRETDTAFKRTTAQAFYKLLSLMGAHIVYNHADYRLMSRRALMNFERFKESNLFIRGIVPLIGLKSASVYYDRLERIAGESKYPLKKMLSFAFDGITSFSVTPIRAVTVIGFILFGISLLAGIYGIISKILGQAVSGWASLILSVWFIGGIQLVCLGLIGEYIGKIYMEVKGRPSFIVEKVITAHCEPVHATVPPYKPAGES
ncbi:MAG: ykoT [Bacilli bacterium]|nr:ykoT [Bacilli bacterium]